jgi:2-oxoglutarate ferredoxin oxidoreductase subunit alpha
MSREGIVIRLGGEGGEGVISAGDILTLSAARSGYQVFTFRTYPSDMKGGHAWYQARIAASPVQSMGDEIDVLVAFDHVTYDTHIRDLQSHGVLVYDPDEMTPHPSPDIVTYPIPFGRIARRDLGFPRGKNVIVMGAVAGLFGLDVTPLRGLVEEKFKRHPEAAEKNTLALHTGYRFAQEHLRKADTFSLGETKRTERVVMNGNNSVTAGALAAGCRFFAGYPITPATEILEEMSHVMPRIGGVCFQSEDEIAAIGAVLGASYGGIKAMTATSGPGLSLMSEFISWSGMAEVPCVVVDVQRGGPSTGLPTKLEQADLNHAVFGGHGDFPRVVLAASSVEDAFYQTINAFNIAEQCQLPVILLSDQSLSHRTESMPIPGTDMLEVHERLRAGTGDISGGYKRYAITSTGVSPMTVPGISGGGYIATGLEHNERGFVRDLTASHERMMPKRASKLHSIAGELPPPTRHGKEEAEIGIISWGSTEGAVQEAIQQANAAGLDVSGLHLRTLYPLAAEPLREFASAIRHIIMPELNYSGQMADYLAPHLGTNVTKLNKFSGVPFTAREIYRKIREVAGDG